MTNQVSGAGGGGKSGGGGSVYTPKEAANTLRSKSTARVIDLLSEGEIEGLVDGAKSIFFNEVPVQNNDNTYNFDGVNFTVKTGTPNQDVIEGFEESEAEKGVNQEIQFAAPVIFTITDSDVSSARVKCRIPAFYEQKTNGDLVGTSVTIQIDVQPNGGSYSQVLSKTIKGKTVGPYEEAFRIPLTGNAPWQIRVRRTTAESSSAAKVDAVYVSTYTEIIEQSFSYPDSAIIGLEVDSQLFGGRIPRRAYHIKGLRIKIPSNYDPIARTYTGMWDGTFSSAWSNNPAWVMYDLLTDTRYGLGEFIQESQIDKWALYEIAQYCDELVDDGDGGTEPRFVLNAVINSREDAFNVITSVASVFRGMAYWSAGSIGFSQDSPHEIDRIVAPANVIGGSFNYEGSALEARHTSAIVSWNDPDDFYRATVEVINDGPEIAKRGYKPVDVYAFGTTSRGQAWRLGKWILDSEKYETETISYTAGYDHADLLPGSIIGISDPARAGLRLGGRILGVSGDDLTLDQTVTTEAGDQIMVVLADDTLNTRDINPVTDSDTVTVTVSLDGPLAENAMYIIQTQNVEPTTWRVITNKEAEKGRFEITALKFDPDKYDRVEDNIFLPARTTSLLPTGPLSAPGDISVQETLYKSNNAVKNRASISWEPSPDPRTVLYRLDVEPPSGNLYTLQIAPSTVAEIPDAEAGDYSFTVYSLTSSASNGELVSSSTKAVTLLGKTEPPDDVQNLTAARRVDGVELSWDEVTDLDLIGYDIREGNDWDNYERIVISKYVGTRIFIPLTTTDQVTLMVRARDELGNLSDGIASVVTSITPIPDITNLNAYQVGSQVKLDWDDVPGIDKIQFEIRYGDSTFTSADWGSATRFAKTNTSEFRGELSVQSTTSVVFLVRPFVELEAAGGSLPEVSYGPIATVDHTQLPVRGQNVLATQNEHTSWTGSKSNVSVNGSNELVLDEGQTEGYYEFTVDITSQIANPADRFGRVWFEYDGVLVAASPLEIDEATGEIDAATYDITPSYEAEPQIFIYYKKDDISDYLADATYDLADATDELASFTPLIPFQEADYSFNSRTYRVVLKRNETDDFRPGLSSLTFVMDVPDRML